MKVIKYIVLSALALASVLLCWMNYDSINTPIEFEAQRDVRQKQVINRLIDIRKAQIEYKTVYGKYCGNLDSLVYFVRNGQMPLVSKSGELTDVQLSKGLTEEKALYLIANDLADSASVYGIDDFEAFKNEFRRDTSYVSVAESIFPKGYAIDSIPYVPFGNGARFEMDTVTVSTKSGIPLPLFEAKVDYNVFLNGLNHQQIVNLRDKAKKLDKFPGLKVGDIVAPNNNAGNWE